MGDMLYDLGVDDETQLSIMLTINRFLSSDEAKLSFPTSLISKERRLVHKLCEHFGLTTRTLGKGSGRFVLCVKDESLLKIDEPNSFTLSPHTIQQLLQFCLSYPLNHKERLELLVRTEKFGNPPPDEVDKNKAVGRINIGLALVPTCFQFNYTKDPISLSKLDIINSINTYQITLISGDNGVGKSTQVPKYILEFAQSQKKAVRLVFIQNSRLLAVSMAENLASQLAEKVGQTVGYQIRLESRVSPTTVLTFCTPWVFLRNLISMDPDISRITHIIIDDVDCRVKAVDLILVYLKLSMLPKNKAMKLILLSSPQPYTQHLFQKYFAAFSTTQLLNVGKQMDCKRVTEMFLGQTLQYVGLLNDELLTFTKAIPTRALTLQKLREVLSFPHQSNNAHRQDRRDKFKDTPALAALLNFFTTHYRNAGEFKEKLDKFLLTRRDSISQSSSSQVSPSSGGDTTHNKSALFFTYGSNGGGGDDNNRGIQYPYHNMHPMLPGLLDAAMEEAWYFEWSLNTNPPTGPASTSSPSPIGTPRSCLDECTNTLTTINQRRRYLDALLEIFMAYGIEVDRAHSVLDVTLLMMCSGLGLCSLVEKLIYYGANQNRYCYLDGSIPTDWALAFDKPETVSLLQTFKDMMGEMAFEEARLLLDNMDEPENLLEPRYTHLSMARLYYEKIHFNNINNCNGGQQGLGARDLLLTLIINLVNELNFQHNQQQQSPKKGSKCILVFLPTCDEITRTKEALLSDPVFSAASSHNKVRVYVLYREMVASDLKQIYQSIGDECVKLILATDIAETSVPISDIAYVIDNGLVEKEIYDCKNNASRHGLCWLSKENYENRINVLKKGWTSATGSPGLICFRLYTELRASHLIERYPSPFSLGSLSELLLQAKYLAPLNSSLQDFLGKAPEPPSNSVMRSMVQHLKALDALDDCLDLTELGQHLVDIPLHPCLGKMILHSIVLKCLDPVLTIACALAQPAKSKSPFVTPSIATKSSIISVKYRYSEKTFSDHMILLRVFQGWQKARVDGWEKQFCSRNGLSPSNLDAIFTLRAHILGQLRASGLVRSRGFGDIRDLNINSENWPAVKAVLCTSLYPNLARVIHSPQLDTLQNPDEKDRIEMGELLLGLNVILLTVCGGNAGKGSALSNSSPQTVRINQKSPPTLGTDSDVYNEESSLSNYQLSQNSTTSLCERKVKLGPEVCFASNSLASSVSLKSNRSFGNNSLWATFCPSDWIIYDSCFQLKPFLDEGSGTGNGNLGKSHFDCKEVPLGCAGYLQGCTLVSPITVLLFAGPNRTPKEFVQDIENPESIQNMAGVMVEVESDSGDDSDHNQAGSNRGDDNNSSCATPHPSSKQQRSITLTTELKLDEGLVFQNDLEVLRNVLHLRQKYHSLVLRRLKNPSKPCSPTDETTLKMVISILAQEENALGLPQPSGVGQRPKPMSTEQSNNNNTNNDEPPLLSSPPNPSSFNPHQRDMMGAMTNLSLNDSDNRSAHSQDMGYYNNHGTFYDPSPHIYSQQNPAFVSAPAITIPPPQAPESSLVRFYLIKPTVSPGSHVVAGGNAKYIPSPYQVPASVSMGTPDDYCNYPQLDHEIKRILETTHYFNLSQNDEQLSLSGNCRGVKTVIGFIFNPVSKIFLGIVKCMIVQGGDVPNPSLPPAQTTLNTTTAIVLQLDWIVKKMVEVHSILNDPLTLTLPHLEPMIRSNQVLCELDINLVPYLLKYFQE